MSEQYALIEVEPRESPPCSATGLDCEYKIVDTTASNGAVHHVPTCIRCGDRRQPVSKPGNENKRREGTKNWKWIPHLRSLHPDGRLHCAYCDMTADEPGGNGEVHHIVPINAGGKDIQSNVMWLCTLHHMVVHAEHRRTEILRRAMRQYQERRYAK